MMLFFGLTLIMFVKNTRFSDLRNSLKKLEKKKATLTLALLFTFATSFAQHNNNHQLTEKQTDSILNANIVDKQHAEEYSKLIIQDAGGRMKPIHTFASELLRKVHRNDTFKGMDANQVVISIQQNPRFWFNTPIIYIKKENSKLRDFIGIPQNQEYARVKDFFTDKGVYKIADEQEKAFKQRIKSKYQQSVIDVDRRVNLLYSAIFGDLFTLFPIPNDETNKWVSQNQLDSKNFSGIDSVYVKQILPAYIQTLAKAKQTNDYSESEEILTGIKNFQQKYGSAVYPSENKIELELFYNKYDIFKSLYKYYLYAGTLLFLFVIIRIFKTSKTINLLIKIGTAIIIGLFIYQTIGLGIRWYISGHAPWSNAYESMIYISWATMIFGLLLGKKSALTIAATTFVVSVILMIAHWNWMDPSIGNLVPVLDSYWLMIHVAIIVASYGPFVLSMILGTLSLLLMVITTENNKKKLGLTIKEITIINEMSMTVGLILLTIGNFLGGIWANESWGRYWGWDPKETWALISIMIYAFILHTRLIPGLRGRFSFNAMSVISFSTILMTYLGVNHLLSGLHSYAAGESVPVPMEIWSWLGGSLLLCVFAYFKYKKYYKK
jgi:cytochrome c-type biogenesis protein CcsB